jgi:hypothetical protein
VPQCQAFVAEFCAETELTPETMAQCEQQRLPCCEFLAECDSVKTLKCLIA